MGGFVWMHKFTYTHTHHICTCTLFPTPYNHLEYEIWSTISIIVWMHKCTYSVQLHHFTACAHVHNHLESMKSDPLSLSQHYTILRRYQRRHFAAPARIALLPKHITSKTRHFQSLTLPKHVASKTFHFQNTPLLKHATSKTRHFQKTCIL